MDARKKEPMLRPLIASDVMNPQVLTVRDDMTLEELARFLVEHEISGAPVEDPEGRLIGVVSVTDVAAAVSERAGVLRDRPSPAPFFREWGERYDPEELAGLAGDDSFTVRDIMTPRVYSVAEEASISEVAETMMESHIHRLLVTRGGRVVGILSTSDLLGLLVEAE
jgi:CBS domain-containing protein